MEILNVHRRNFLFGRRTDILYIVSECAQIEFFVGTVVSECAQMEIFVDRRTDIVQYRKHQYSIINHHHLFVQVRVQYRTIQYNTVQEASVQYHKSSSFVQVRVQVRVQYSTIKYSTIQEVSVQYHKSSSFIQVQYSTLLYRKHQ
jgi:hypothetical protein